MKKPFHLFMTLGLTSVTAQILLMRELVVVFYGNELSLGIMLGSWLFWVGIGSLAAGKLLPRLAVFGKTNTLALLQAGLGILCVITLLGVRLLPALLQRGTAGEIVGYLPIAVSSFLLLAPVCLLAGFLFAAFCHSWDDGGAASITSVYLFEGLGAATGGILFSFLLVRYFEPVHVALLLLIINLAAAASLLALRRAPALLTGAFSVLALALAALAPLKLGPQLTQQSLRWLWRGLHIVDSRDSAYGNVAFIEDGEQKSLYENGLLMFSYPDRLAAEESVHFALLSHPVPKRVLLIGGGAGGSLGEVLKHPVEHVDYLELDPLIITMVRAHFPAEARKALSDARVSVHNIDGRLFLSQTSRRYDVILIDLPDPYTAQLNRFYTLEFFRLCKQRLAVGGILSFRISSSEDYFSPELRQFLGCINTTLRAVFPDVAVVPGDTNIFLASSSPRQLTVDADWFIERLAQRGIKDKLLFIREYYLPFRLSQERLQTLSAALSVTGAEVNTDLTPVCFYYDAVLWSKQFKDYSSRILSTLSRISPGAVFAGVGFLVAIGVLFAAFSPRKWGPRSLLFAVGATGFTQITVEVVALLGFQVMQGYVYQKIALIVAACMLGLSLGSAIMGRKLASSGATPLMLLVIQALVFLCPLLLLAALLLMSGGKNEFLNASQADVIFPLMALLTGIVGGMQFPLANALWLQEMPGVARAAGLTYGTDLFGSCLGALFVTTILIPLYGVPFACVIAAALGLSSVLFLLVGSYRNRA